MHVVSQDPAENSGAKPDVGTGAQIFHPRRIPIEMRQTLGLGVRRKHVKLISLSSVQFRKLV